MSIYSTAPLALGNVRTYPLSSRKSKVSVADFAKPAAAKISFAGFLDSLPNFLAAENLRELLAAMQRARKGKRTILWGIGGHVIKVGLGPVLIGLMERGFISGIAMNGAALIHDFEIAVAGNTSEDVDASLGEGKFGMARETGEQLNEIAKDAARSRIGYGEAAGKFLCSGGAKARYAESQRPGGGLSPAYSGDSARGDRKRYPAHASGGGWSGAWARPRIGTFFFSARW